MASTSEDIAPTIPKPKVVKIKRLQIGVNVVVQILVLSAIVIALNYISFRHFKRWDFSRSQKYALSSQTINLLGNLPKPVRAIVFFNSSSQGAGEIYSDVLSLLKEYEYASRKKLTVELVDPYRNITRAKDLAAQYKFGANESILILDYDGRSKFINAAEMAEMDMGNPMLGTAPEVKSFKGESAITSALVELIEEKQKKVYLVAGHGEPELNGPEINAFREYVKRQNIKMEPLRLGDFDAVPQDASALALFGTRADYSELEIQRIADFWSRQGRLFILLNPDAKTPRLNRWLSTVGITPRGDWVLKKGTTVGLDENQQLETKAAVYLSAVGVISPAGQSITRDLAGIDTQLLGHATSLNVESAQEQIQKQRFTTLIESGKDFWGETEFVRGENKQVIFDPQKDNQGPLALGVAVERGAMDDPHVNVETARMIVIGNSGFLTDDGLRMSETGIELALHALNWLLNREQTFGGIPPKEKKTVTLTLNERELRNLALSLMFGIPGAVAILGLAVSWTRRH